jgi:RNA polymerase sigma-70 factor (ECF subfamily)
MMIAEEDTELLERWRRADGRAGSALVKRHFPALHRFFANKARGYEDDLIQQTFVACVEDRDAFRGDASFRAYLFGLARHQLMDHYRRIYRRQHLDFTSTSLCDLGTSPTGSLARQEERELLDLALRELPVDQQIALELTYWEELAAPEVASVLGIPENTVYSRLRRGKAHLREALERLTQVPAKRERVLALFGAR